MSDEECPISVEGPHGPASKKVVAMLYDAIPRQRVCTQGMSIMGKVVYTKNPYEFYIIPKKEWTCICENHPAKDIPKEYYIEKGCPYFMHCGLESFDIIMKKMQVEIENYLKTVGNLPKPTNYLHSEVVAYAMKLSETREFRVWRRAVITTQPYLPFDKNQGGLPFGQLHVDLTMLDSGEKVNGVRTEYLCWLPENFSKIPPYAYKCSLCGILPVCLVWDSSATNFFKSLVDQKEVLIEIKKTVFPDKDGLAGVFGEKPYYVSLRVRSEDDPNVWTCLEYEMVKRFLAVPFNPLFMNFKRRLDLNNEAELLERNKDTLGKGPRFIPG